MKLFRLVCICMLSVPLLSVAQKKGIERKGELYFSWGYNKEWYTRSNVLIDQPSLGASYTLHNVYSHDHPGWDEGLFSMPISVPQYNYRLGYFFNREKGWGFEINFDHTKHIIQDGQSIKVSGTMKGRKMDSTVIFSESNGFYYYLNNGANFLLFNIVKRWNSYENRKGTVRLDVLAKAGIGPVIPHVQNSLFGQPNEPGFQIGGWNIGLEAGCRGTFFKHLYLEFTNKIDYASYSGLRVYEGTAKQAFGTYELILSLGYTIQVGKKQDQ